MDEHSKKLEEEIRALKDRNARVEAEKAWEVSGFRTMTIAAITYVVAAVILYSMGVKEFFLSAFVPTAGYILSIQSLPVIKKWWTGRHLERE